MTGRLASLGWALLLLAGCGAHVLPEVHSDAERMALAHQLMSQRHYDQAIELLKSYVAVGAGSADVDQAIELLGECYLLRKEWPLASTEFERLLRDYPESDSAGSASFGIGEALFGQARPPDFDQEYTTRAVEQWQTYLRQYPGHWRNGEATMRLERARHQLAVKLINNARLYLKLGLAGPARLTTLFKYAVRCGVGPSIRALGARPALFAKLTTERDPESIVRAIVHARSAGGLGELGIHLFSFGGLAHTCAWLHALAAR